MSLFCLAIHIHLFYFLDSAYYWYHITFVLLCLTFHWVYCSLGHLMFLQMAEFHSFYGWHCVCVCVCVHISHFSVFILLFMDTSVASISWILEIMLHWGAYMFSKECCFFSGYIPKSRIVELYGNVLFVCFLRCLYVVFHSNGTNFHSTNSVGVFPFLWILYNIFHL